jgi:hypothetical protein
VQHRAEDAGLVADRLVGRSTPGTGGPDGQHQDCGERGDSSATARKAVGIEATTARSCSGDGVFADLRLRPQQGPPAIALPARL